MDDEFEQSDNDGSDCDNADEALQREVSAFNLTAELKEKCLGTFRVSTGDIDFNWSNHMPVKNRDIIPAHVGELLNTFQKTTLLRLLDRNHLSALMTETDFQAAVDLTATETGVDLRSHAHPTFKVCPLCLIDLYLILMTSSRCIKSPSQWRL